MTGTDKVQPPRSATVEAAILEAASDLLASHGLRGLSMRQVAERVGVSATAIYHYFDGKQALIHRVVHLGFERFGEYLADAVAPHPKGSIERIVSLGQAYIRFALENRTYFRVIFSIQSQESGLYDDLPEGGGYHLLREVVADAMEAGVLRGSNPELVSLYLWSTVHGLVTLSLSGACERCRAEGVPAASAELYDAFAPFIADGIRRPGGDTRGEDGLEDSC
jgi:AcrR family transcriptional regulator